MASLLFKSAAAVAVGTFVESKYGPSLGATGPLGVSPLFGATPLILIGTGFWAITFGFEVGKARRKYSEQAKKDGEENVSERYDLPNLYAQGTSINARAFNCVQRAHQQIFEHFTQVAVSSLVGAVHYPICTALATLTYFAGRRAFSNCYAAGEGDASKRYSSKLAAYMWYAIMSLTLLGSLSCVNILAGRKVW